MPAESDRDGATVRMARSSPDALFVIDRRGVVQRSSGDIAGMLGPVGPSLRGASMAEILTEESAARLVAGAGNALDAGFGTPTIVLEGLTAVKRDGTHLPVEALLVALAPGSGRDDTVLVTLRDDRRSVGRREVEREMRDRLESSNRDLEAFASVAAHDLQEPLRKIRAFSDRVGISLRAGETERAGEYLERVDAAAARMQMLLDDLLVLARVSGQDPERTRLDLTGLVREVASDLQPSVPEATITIADLPVVEADPVRMRQLFANLIGNALKYRRPDEPPEITVTGARQEGRIVIEVTDNGIGFEDQYRERIFRPFQRLHGRGEYEGSGVGLALCRAIVERHEGTLTAHGTPGEGATFRVMLPAPST